LEQSDKSRKVGNRKNAGGKENTEQHTEGKTAREQVLGKRNPGEELQPGRGNKKTAASSLEKKGKGKKAKGNTAWKKGKQPSLQANELSEDRRQPRFKKKKRPARRRGTEKKPTLWESTGGSGDFNHSNGKEEGALKPCGKGEAV